MALRRENEHKVPRSSSMPNDWFKANRIYDEWHFWSWKERCESYYNRGAGGSWDPILARWVGEARVVPIIPHATNYYFAAYVLGMAKEDGFGVVYSVQNGLVLMKGISGPLNHADIVISTTANASPGEYHVVVVNKALLTEELSAIRLLRSPKCLAVTTWGEVNGRCLQFHPNKRDSGDLMELPHGLLDRTASRKALAFRSFMGFLMRARKQVPGWQDDWAEEGVAFQVMSAYGKLLRKSMVQHLIAEVLDSDDKTAAVEEFVKATGFEDHATQKPQEEEQYMAKVLLQDWIGKEFEPAAED